VGRYGYGADKPNGDRWADKGEPVTSRTFQHPERLVRLAALGVPAAVAAALVPVRTSFPGIDAALVMVVVIVGVAAWGDRLAGALAAISAGIWFDFFLTRPYQTFDINHRPDIETTALLFAVGLAVTELTARGRHHRAVAAEESTYVAALHDVARMMAEGDDPEEIVTRVEGVLATLLELRSCRYSPGPPTEPTAVISQEGAVLLAGFSWNTLPGDRVELPVQYQGHLFGRFVLVPSPGVTVPLERRLVATALANEIGAVLAGIRRPQH
jgi:K+-sensing histidine kinase KdpD